MKSVKEILDKKLPQFNIISAEAKVIEALSVMKCTDLGYVIVMDNDNYEGIMCEKDYSQKVVLTGRHSDETKVRDIMITDFPTVSPEESSGHCLDLMNSFKIMYLPVFDGLSFKGVIAINDLMRESAEENQKSGRDLFATSPGIEKPDYYII